MPFSLCPKHFILVISRPRPRHDEPSALKCSRLDIHYPSPITINFTPFNDQLVFMWSGWPWFFWPFLLIPVHRLLGNVRFALRSVQHQDFPRKQSSCHLTKTPQSLKFSIVNTNQKGGGLGEKRPTTSFFKIVPEEYVLHIQAEQPWKQTLFAKFGTGWRNFLDSCCCCWKIFNLKSFPALVTPTNFIYGNLFINILYRFSNYYILNIVSIRILAYRTPQRRWWEPLQQWDRHLPAKGKPLVARWHLPRRNHHWAKSSSPHDAF